MKTTLSWKKLAFISLSILAGCALAVFAVQAAAGYAAYPVAGVNILASDSDGITLEFTVPDLHVARSESAGQACLSLSLPGYSPSAAPGAALLPAKGFLIGIPPGASLSSQVLNLHTVESPVSAPLCPASQSIAQFDPDGLPQGVFQQETWDRQFYQQDQFQPAEWIEVSDLGKIRSQSVARLSFSPLRYNPAQGLLRQVTHLVVRVSFSSPANPPANETTIDEGPFEATLRSSLLNYQQARDWRTAPPTSSPAAPDLASLPQPAFKILLNQDGLYQLTYADLAAAGVPLASWDPRRIQVAIQDQPIAIQVIGEQDGVFDPSDAILFYGQKIHNKYTTTNVYWLYQDSLNGLRMPLLNAAPGQPAAVPPAFLDTLHMEEDHIYQSARPSGPDLDHWYWNRMQATSSTGTVTKAYTATLPSLSTTPFNASLRGLLRGFSGSPSQRVRILINGNLAHDSTWPSDKEYAFEVPIAQAWLTAGANQLVVEAPIGGGITQQTFYVNRFEIDFSRSYQLIDDLLPFSVDTPGDWEVELVGGAGDDLQIFEISDPAQPRQLINVLRSGSPGSFTYRFFNHSTSTPPRFLAIAPQHWLKPVDLRADTPADLRAASNSADYLVITHADLITEAQRLADFRAAQGLRSLVIDVEDIYDQFGQGDLDPPAIRDFLAYAYQNWQSPTPSFVVLFGDGHYDFKRFQGYDQSTYIPPYLADVDPGMGETASDNRYVTISGADPLPDLHIGRLPANDLAQAASMVDKIISYETSQPPANGWVSNVLFAADNPDGVANFPAASDELVNGYLPSGYTADKVYLGQNYPLVADAKAALINGINQGRLLVSYIGHASVQTWAFEKLFALSDLSLLTNADRLAFFVPMTCLEGYFINPFSGSSSLAESLVRLPSAGAIASWSPTGQGVATGHDILEKGLFEAIFQENHTMLGPATTQARLYFYANSFGFWDLLDTYILLGDPATRLNTIYQLSPRLNYLPSVQRR